MNSCKTYHPSNREQVFFTLSREILAARLKVTLDQQLNRKTSPAVQSPVLTRKTYLFDTLRREILAARLKVTLDQELNRGTSPRVKRLAQMKLPPIVRNESAIIGQ